MKVLQHNRNYTLFVVRSFISSLGNWTYYFALTLFIYRLTHQASALGLLTLMYTLPAVVISPIAGRLADRMSRTTVIVTTDGLRALVMFVLPLTHQLILVYLLVLLEQLFADASNPSAQALIPQILEGDQQYLAGNAGISAASSSGRILGGVVGTVTFSLYGILAPFWLDSLSFLVAGGLVLLMRVPRTGFTLSRPTDQSWAVWRLLQSQREKWPIAYRQMLWSMLIMVSSSWISTFLVVYIRTVLKAPDKMLGILMAAQALGVVIGSISVAAWTKSLGSVASLTSTYRWLFTGFNILLMALMLMHQWYVAGIILVTFGALEAWFSTITQTIVQLVVPNDNQGRAYGALNSLTNTAFLVGSLGGGYLISAFGIRPVVMISSGAITLVGVAALWLHRGRAGGDES